MGGQPAGIPAPLQLATLRPRPRVADVSLKQGKGGALVFVKVQHEAAGGTLPLREGHDIVIAKRPSPAIRPTAVPPADLACPRAPARCTLLFRWPALTFNSHRITMTIPTTVVEGYDDLIVHGPLIATLLLKRRNSATGAARCVVQLQGRPSADLRRFARMRPRTAARRHRRVVGRGRAGALPMQATQVGMKPININSTPFP